MACIYLILLYAQVQLSTSYINHKYFTKIYKPVFTGLNGIGGASKIEIALGLSIAMQK